MFIGLCPRARCYGKNYFLSCMRGFGTTFFSLGCIAFYYCRLSFWVARFVLGNYVQKNWGSYLRVFNAEMERYGGWYLLLIRLMPIFPFFLVNSVIALTTISIRAYGAATFFGIIPPTLVFVFAGTQLALVNTISDILSYKVLGALGLLVILVLVPFMYQRFFARR